MSSWQVALIGVFAPLGGVAYIYAILWLMRKIDKLLKERD